MDMVQVDPMYIIEKKTFVMIKHRKIATPYVKILATGSPNNLHRIRIIRIGKVSR